MFKEISLNPQPDAEDLFHPDRETDGWMDERTVVKILIVRFPNSLLDLNKI